MASTMNVPFFGLDRQYARYREDFLKIADRVLSTGQVLQGKDVEILEAKLAEVCGRRHAVAVGSCTDALAFALQASGVGAGDKQRETERELQVKAQIGSSLPVERELERWFPLWGAPI